MSHPNHKKRREERRAREEILKLRTFDHLDPTPQEAVCAIIVKKHNPKLYYELGKDPFLEPYKSNIPYRNPAFK